MQDALLRCYPASLILKQSLATPHSSPAETTAKGSLHHKSNTPHHGPQQGGHLQPHPPFFESQENQESACTKAAEHATDATAIITEVTSQLEPFSTCLNNGKWKNDFDVSTVTLQQISAAAAVLMAHWESSADGALL